MTLLSDRTGGFSAWRSHPWGGEAAARCHARCKLRHIVLRPGHATRPEAHCHRVEHWVVIQGAGRAEIGGECRALSENDTLTVPLGLTHRIENTGLIDLHLIAVETGCYLEDDDCLPDHAQA